MLRSPEKKSRSRQTREQVLQAAAQLPRPSSPPTANRHRSPGKTKAAKVKEIRAALEASGDTYIVDDAEDFELVEVLGLGSFGQAELRRVSNSDGASDGSFIVIKRVPLQALNEWAVGALMREVTNGASMRHRHIVSLYGAYLSERSELCMALQYAAGGTLEDTVAFQKEKGPFETEFVTMWLAQLCDAVQYMHDRRVLHRDISTGNVFLSYYGDVLLGDLGLSRSLAKDTVGATKVGTQVGTPPYMSPELVRGQDYGTSSDVWAIGVVLFELLTFVRPFSGSNFMEIAKLIGDGVPLPAAAKALRECGHPIELRRLASNTGLLNPARQQRTPLSTVLGMYPLQEQHHNKPDDGGGGGGRGAGGGSGDAGGAVSDVALAGLLRTALRPASQRGSGSFRQQRGRDARADERFGGPSASFNDSNAASAPSSMGGCSAGDSSYMGGASSMGGTSDASSRCTINTLDSRQGGHEVFSSMGASSMTPPSSSYGGRSSHFSNSTHVGTRAPQECPAVPASFQPRPNLAELLFARVLADGPHVGLAGASVAFGMGGTGKSILAASIMRHPAVAVRYKRLCWLPVGQTPDLRRLLALLLGQLQQGTRDGEAIANEQLDDLLALQQKVAAATRGLSVLCVLDDVWDPAHARVIGEPLEAAVLVVTSRVHHLLPGAHHVHCGLLSRDESLQLLLRAGDVGLPPSAEVPAAAVEAVELCGRLPLTIALAGAMLQEHADDWERKLVPLLRGDNRAELRKRSLNDADAADDDDDDSDETTEGRVITSSLTLLRSKRNHTSVVLFMMCAAFPEDATVPSSVFDALEQPFGRLVAQDAERRRKDAAAAGAKATRPRRCLKVLLDHSLLQGSIRDGVMMHDLLRAYMLARWAAPELATLHLGILLALSATVGDGSSSPSTKEVRSYAQRHLEHHAAGACATCPTDGGDGDDDAQPPLPLDHDTLRLATAHEAEWVRLAVARGVGLRRVRASARAANAAGRWHFAGQLWLCAVGLGGDHEGEHRWEAWCALRQVSPLTAESVELEALVIRALVLKKGMRINSPEHELVDARLNELLKTDVGRASDNLQAARSSSRATQLFAILCEASGAGRRDRFIAYYDEFMGLGGSRAAQNMGASATAARAYAALQQVSSHNTILHAEAGHTWENEYGPGGAWLRDLVAWYDYSEAKVNGFKASNGRDALLSGLGSAVLQLRWGPGGSSSRPGSMGSGGAGSSNAAAAAAAAADVPWSMCVECWATIACDVQVGKKTWRNHRMDLVDLRATRAAALALGRRDDARRLFEASPEGALFSVHRLAAELADQAGSSASLGSSDDEELRRKALAAGGGAGTGGGSGSGSGESRLREREQLVAEALASHVQSLGQYMAHWQMACRWSRESFELMSRAIGTLLSAPPAAGEEATSVGGASQPSSDGVGVGDALLAEADKWLPSPSALLELAATEKAWDVFMCGAQHPSLACALVYARRGQWGAAREVANGLLALLRQPLTLYEARRLLARCAAFSPTGGAGAAHEHHEHLRAAAAAARAAGYSWLELLSLNELHARGGCDAATVDRLAAQIDGISDATTEGATARKRSSSLGGRNSCDGSTKPLRRVMFDPAAAQAAKEKQRNRKVREPKWQTTPGPIGMGGGSGLLGPGPSGGAPSSASGQQAKAPQTPYISGIGIINGGESLMRAREKAAHTFQRPVRSKRDVKSLNLPLF